MVVKKGFVNINDVDDGKIKDIMKGSALVDRTKSNAGRKPKPEEDKATESMVVYLTAERKGIIQKYCNDNCIPFSTLVNQLLSEKGLV